MAALCLRLPMKSILSSFRLHRQVFSGLLPLSQSLCTDSTLYYHGRKESFPYHKTSIRTYSPGYPNVVIPIVGVIAAKTIEATKNRLKKEDTLILLAKPTHQLQQRKKEIEEIDDKFKELQKSQNKAAITLIVHGAAACGKTQLARQYGEQYFNQVKSKGNISKLATSNVGIVATLDFRNETSLQQSYSRLVTELGFKCCDERLAVLTAKIQKKFQENPEWLLIVDGLNTEEIYHAYHHFLPQPNAEDWGCGRVLVTTNNLSMIRKVYGYNTFAAMYECPKMQEDDAANLLQNVSGFVERGAKKLVNESYVDRNPMDIASVGIIIEKERGLKKEYTYFDFMDEIQKHFEKEGTLPYEPLKEAVKQLAHSDEDLEKIFIAMGMCAHDPVPISVLNRLLNKDVDSLPSVKTCSFLQKIIDIPPVEVSRVYTHFNTLKEFRNVLLYSDDKKDTAYLEQLQRRLVKCVLEEYEQASMDSSVNGKWVQQLLFRHLQQFLEFEDSKKHYLDPDLEIELSVVLSNAHIELNRNPLASKRIMTDLEKELKSSDHYTKPHNHAKINLGWAKVHRCLGQYESSDSCLSEALQQIHHAQLTPSEITECLKECTAIALHYQLSDYDIRENLKKAIKLYTKMVSEESKEILGKAKCALAYLCLKMGDWSKGKHYLEEAEQLLKGNDSEIMDISAQESLATVYAQMGDYKESVHQLKNVIEKLTATYCPDGSPSAILSIPYAKLCSAYYYLGNKEEAKGAFQMCMKSLDQTSLSESHLRESHILEQNEVLRKRPDVPPWAAVHILTSLLCDFWDIHPMKELIDRLANSKSEDSPILLAKLYRHKGYYPRAEKILEGHLRECERNKLKKDSMRIGLIWAELGKVYREQGYIIKGIRAFENAYEIYKQYYGSNDHPEVAFMQAELGRVVQLNGNKELGLQMMKKALEICRKHMNSSEPCAKTTLQISTRYAHILAAYGNVLRYLSHEKHKHLREALEALEEVQDIEKATLNSMGINHIRTLFYLGNVYQEMDSKEKAKENMLESLRLINKIDYTHPYKASILTGLGRLLENSEPKNAEKYMRDAFLIRNNRRKLSDEAHWKIAFAHESLGKMMLKNGDKNEACNNFIKANNMFIKLIERESSEEELWMDSRSSSAPDYGIDIIDRWKTYQKEVCDEILNLLEN